MRTARKFYNLRLFTYVLIRDETDGLECVEECLTTRENCVRLCSEDNTCLKTCNNELAQCMNTCPCYGDCLEGCDGCESAYCSCRDLETNSDFQKCKSDLKDENTRCIANCDVGEWRCISECNRQYDENMSFCPCQSECPQGCPCPNYECLGTTEAPTTTSTTASKIKTSVLVLNTKLNVNVPIITDEFGREDRNFMFMFENGTSAHGGCSITWRNDFYIFGGWGDHRFHHETFMLVS